MPGRPFRFVGALRAPLRRAVFSRLWGRRSRSSGSLARPAATKAAGYRPQRRGCQSKDAEIDALKVRVAALEAEKTGVSSALTDAKKTMEDLLRAQAQAEARAAQFRTLVERFRKMTESGKLKVEIRDNRMIVSLGDRILFDPGKTQVKKEGAETLKQVTAILKEVQRPRLPGRRPHRQCADRIGPLPLELGSLDGARGRGRELHDRQRHGAGPPVGGGLLRPGPGRVERDAGRAQQQPEDRNHPDAEYMIISIASDDAKPGVAGHDAHAKAAQPATGSGGVQPAAATQPKAK